MKKQARSNKQTRQSNTAHPRQSLFLRKISCLGWDSNMYMYMYMYIVHVLRLTFFYGTGTCTCTPGGGWAVLYVCRPWRWHCQGLWKGTASCIYKHLCADVHVVHMYTHRAAMVDWVWVIVIISRLSRKSLTSREGRSFVSWRLLEALMATPSLWTPLDTATAGEMVRHIHVCMYVW